MSDYMSSSFHAGRKTKMRSQSFHADPEDTTMLNIIVLIHETDIDTEKSADRRSVWLRPYPAALVNCVDHHFPHTIAFTIIRSQRAKIYVHL